MTRAETAARNRIICRLADEHDTIQECYMAVLDSGIAMEYNAMTMVLGRAARQRNRRFQCQQEARNTVRPVDKGKTTTAPVEPVHERVTERYKRGDCLMCRKGKYRHPDWPGGVCPACAGTGRYLDSIMKCREKGGQYDPNPN